MLTNKWIKCATNGRTLSQDSLKNEITIYSSLQNSTVSVLKRSSSHHPQASVDNMNVTIYNHCTWKDISSAHKRIARDDEDWASLLAAAKRGARPRSPQ